MCWLTWKGSLGRLIAGWCLLGSCCFWSLAEAPRPAAPLRNPDLLRRGRITEKTRAFRQDLLAKFGDWLEPQLGTFTLDTLARKHIDLLSEYCEEYILHLYTMGQSRVAAAETLNMLVQSYGWLKPSLAGPWGMIRAWEYQEPSIHHPPIPAPVLRALVACALAWDWPKVAVMLALGFFALLRPVECIGLRRQDLALPSDHLEGDVLYVRIGAPKTRFRTSKDQHVRVDEPGLASWIAWTLASMPMWQRIWNGSLAAFRRRYEMLQLEVLKKVLFLPSSLRPGGATYLFRLFQEDLVKLQWRGRWRSFRMLEIYVQELGAAQVWIRFDPSTRQGVLWLGSCFQAVLFACRPVG